MKNIFATAFLLPFLGLAGCARFDSAESSAEKPAKPGPGIFFVATNGNDNWSGTHASAKGTNGPFASFSRAVMAVRESKQPRDGHLQKPVTIFVRDGIYFLNGIVSLKPEDSGTINAPVTFAAYPGETPILSAGRRITGWKEIIVEEKKLWAADVPEARDGNWFFRQLWIDGQRRVRARHPNKGYLKIASLPDVKPDTSWEAGQKRFRFHPGDLKAWKSVDQAEVVAMTRWVESRMPVISIDEKENLMTSSKRSVFQLFPDDPYYIEHVFEALDAPGEWFLDQKKGTLYYLPLPGEDMATVEVIVPKLMQCVRLDGRPEAGQFIQHVCFRGLTFSHNEWYYPSNFGSTERHISTTPDPEIFGFAQAAFGVPGMVQAEGARNVAFEKCKFVNVGSYGVQLGRGCQSNRVFGCVFADLAAGGIRLGETLIRDKPFEQAHHNEVTDCHIHDGGKLFHSGEGIWVGQSYGNRLAHNVIHDFYYTGISIGWTWGYEPSLATNNVVEFNRVHHIGVKSDGDGPILSDMAGFYGLGDQQGTVVRNNLWHDIAGIRYGGWGIYIDEGGSNLTIESNVVYRTTHGGFHLHYGKDNLIRNNIFAFARDYQVQRTRPENHTSFRFQTNIVYFDTGQLFQGEWGDDHYKMEGNIYFDARPGAKPEAMNFAGGPLEPWRKRGHDLHSLVVDPLFVAPKDDDFRLQSNSPALKLGFQPIDVTRVGPRKPLIRPSATFSPSDGRKE